MEAQWTKRYPSCQNCGTTRHEHRARGYCTRCYPLLRRIETIKKWDLSNLKSLRGYPNDRTYLNQKDFQQISEGLTRQIKERLEELKNWEALRNSDIEPDTLEFQLRRIAKYAGVKRDIFFGKAGYLQDHFDPEQRRVLFQLLNNIEEARRWSGIDYGRVFSPYRERPD